MHQIQCAIRPNLHRHLQHHRYRLIKPRIRRPIVLYPPLLHFPVQAAPLPVVFEGIAIGSDVERGIEEVYVEVLGVGRCGWGGISRFDICSLRTSLHILDEVFRIGIVKAKHLLYLRHPLLTAHRLHLLHDLLLVHFFGVLLLLFLGTAQRLFQVVHVFELHSLRGLQYALRQRGRELQEVPVGPEEVGEVRLGGGREVLGVVWAW